MKGTDFDELAFFRAIMSIGARSLLIGRRALVVLGLPVPTVEGQAVTFDELWAARELVPLTDDVSVALPSVAGLILTKRFAARPRDVEDIGLLEVLRAERER